MERHACADWLCARAGVFARARTLAHACSGTEALVVGDDRLHVSCMTSLGCALLSTLSVVLLSSSNSGYSCRNVPSIRFGAARLSHDLSGLRSAVDLVRFLVLFSIL